MARTDNLTNFLTDVASAIKTKKGSQTAIQASSFDTEIANLPSGSDTPEIDWDNIEYVEDDPSWVNDMAMEHALSIRNSYDPEYDTDWEQRFEEDEYLIYFPQLDTSNITNFSYAFANCPKIMVFPEIDMSSATSVYRMFYGVTTLTTDSVNNILKSLKTATGLSSSEKHLYSVINIDENSYNYDSELVADLANDGWEY